MRTRGHLSDVWRYRFLLQNLVFRELKIKYKGAVLGVFWSMLQPLFLLLVYTFAFRYVVRIRVEHFPVFLFAVLLPWTFLSTSLGAGVSAITDHGSLVKKIYFPRAVLPLATVFFNLIQFLLTLLVFIPALPLLEVPLTPALLALPLLIALQLPFVAGLVLAASALYVSFRDLRHFVELLLQFWFWLTPVVYPLDLVPARFAPFFVLNPMVHFAGAYRKLILTGRLPSIPEWLLLAALSGVFFAAGWRIFQRRSPRFAEEV